MAFSSGKNVTVNIWQRGITLQGRILTWNQREVVVNDKRTRTTWTFPYQDILSGKVKISALHTH